MISLLNNRCYIKFRQLTKTAFLSFIINNAGKGTKISMQINRINFGSTYEISRQYTHLNRKQEAKLKKHSLKYDNSLYDKEKGVYRFSVRADYDEKIESFLKSLGIKVYKRFKSHNISRNSLETYTKEANECKKFEWIGK